MRFLANADGLKSDSYDSLCIALSVVCLSQYNEQFEAFARKNIDVVQKNCNVVFFDFIDKHKASVVNSLNGTSPVGAVVFSGGKYNSGSDSELQ
jgi:hypothetical protein